jgi:hypothetical protein
MIFAVESIIYDVLSPLGSVVFSGALAAAFQLKICSGGV